jgi:DnaJ-class molecular chaperone
MDYFGILELGRKAALEEEVLRKAFHEAGKAVHPDAASAPLDPDATVGRGLSLHASERQGDFEVVGEAYGVLRDPGKRLKHLLGLEFPEEEIGGGRGMVSGDLLDLFGRAGEVLQGADEVLRKKAAATTALGKAMLAKEEIAAQQAVQEVGFEIDALRRAEEERLLEFDGLLARDREAALLLGTEMVRRFGFLTKWQARVREQVTAFLLSE